MPSKKTIRVLMVFALILLSQIFFLEKNFIRDKFIASTLQARKDNEEICCILYSKDDKIGKKIYIKNTDY